MMRQGILLPKWETKNIHLLILVLLFCSSMLSAERVGKILYKGYAENFNDTTMEVPRDIVAMTEYIYVSHPESLAILVDTPSIFFIIDHSGSMYEYDYDSASSTLEIPQDPMGNRFKKERPAWRGSKSVSTSSTV